jgi:hypothetical protein
MPRQKLEPEGKWPGRPPPGWDQDLARLASRARRRLPLFPSRSS